MDDHVLDRVFQRKYLPHWLFVGGVGLLVVSAFIWWTQVYENPYNVYWAMLTNSLSTSSETKHLVGNANGTRLDQYISQQFGVNPMAYGRTTLASATSTVQTESIGTLTADYIRYTNVQTEQKSSTGKTLNFSKVLGKWAEAPALNIGGSTGATPFFAQTVLGLGGGNLIPIANLSSDQRQNLLSMLHQNVIFSTSFNNVQKQTLSGRTVYVYTVAIEPVAYVGFEKAFATDLDLHTLDNLDPNNYQGQQPVVVKLSVDVASRRLAEISYANTVHQEFFSSYGVPISQPVPKATISDQALQNLIAQIQ